MRYVMKQNKKQIRGGLMHKIQNEYDEDNKKFHTRSYTADLINTSIEQTLHIKEN